MKTDNLKITILPLLLMSVLLSGCESLSDVFDRDGDWMDMSGSFNGWNRVGDANWRIENGEFVADSSSGPSYLVTNDSYSDFQIQLEFWTDAPGSNSGVFSRISNPQSIADTTAYEANIFDARPDQSGRTGAIVNHAPPSTVMDTSGKWNSYDIMMDDDHIVVKLNGVTTVDFDDDMFSSGPIGLQYGSGTIKFRNVRIRRI